jgi:hypothetical protein
MKLKNQLLLENIEFIDQNNIQHLFTQLHHTLLHHMKQDHNILLKQTNTQDNTLSLLKHTQRITLINHIQLTKFTFHHTKLATNQNIKLLFIQKNIKKILIIINN